MGKVIDAEIVEIDEEIKTEVKEKKEKKPLRKRIGERLVSDEPLIPKKVKRGIAVGGGLLATAGAIVAAFIMRGSGAEIPDMLPEIAEDLDEIPFDDATNAVVETVTE